MKVTWLLVMKLTWLLALGCIVTAANMTGTTISYGISPVGLDSAGNMVYKYTYNVSGLTLQSTQELDLYFNSAIFDTLSDPVASSAFQTVLAQPNNPPGAPGDFGLIPNSDDTVVTGPFSIDFILHGSATPGSQPYTITQYLPNGVAIGVIGSGTTVPANAVSTPEAASIVLTGIALLFGSVLGVARSRSARRLA